MSEVIGYILKVIGYILVGALIIVFFATLIGVVLGASGISIGVGLFISVFAGFFSAIKSCVIGINRSVSNMFVKVTLFIVIGLVVLAIAAPIVLHIVGIIMSFI